LSKLKKYCNENGCDGIMKITYFKERNNGDKIRTRKCDSCGRYKRTTEVNKEKYDRMRQLTIDLQKAIKKFMKE
jgi:hypothetical protein